MSVREACGRLGITRNTATKWLKDGQISDEEVRFSEGQVAYTLRMADGGTPVVDMCRLIGISEATFYKWKKKYSDQAA